MFQLKTYVVKDIIEIEFIKCLFFLVFVVGLYVLSGTRFCMLTLNIYSKLCSILGLKLNISKIIIYFTLNIIAGNYSIQYSGKNNNIRTGNFLIA